MGLRSAPGQLGLYLALQGDALPKGSGAQPQLAAANGHDVVIWVPSGPKGRTTWLLKVDTNETDASATQGVEPETLAFRGDEDMPRPGLRSYDPAFYDAQSIPAASDVQQQWDDVPKNIWTKMSQPKAVDEAGWGTSAFDPHRHQVLYWGGGHSEYKGTNVIHYSLRTNRWSISARPDLVLEWTAGFLCPAMMSFNNRPNVPVHAYQTYAYDPPSAKMIAIRDGTRSYDVSRREWDYPPIETPFKTKVLYMALESTPSGVIAWSTDGRADRSKLYRLDVAAQKWNELPLDGPSLSRPYCDGSTMLYDSKRDALWLAPGNKLYRYDLADGKLQKIATTAPAVLGKYALWREQVYVPGADLIITMRRFGPDGQKHHVAYDPAANEWFKVELPFEDGKSRNFSWSDALMYDAETDRVLLHDSPSFWVLNFDRSSAKMSELQ